ncbi:AraC family transcriptional regulator [Pseudolysinimonas kribbensis]|uniref:AraC family transcriptional regulator n=1 Tax=Pseudolysinimonas kribbensis TaxID=433641 RepID=A0ABQ6K9E2_9MICO|nr:AraC family transcriptional regulator [Pseudolysinimonas kribbensis]GMA95331.1 AraC family transcriptional regulator [Pseudolysinimonas kribbensis]
MRERERVRAWRPAVPGIHEVLHAEFHEHAYPLHTHAEWSLLLIDAGEVAYRLEGRARRAPTATLTILPPGVPHDGRSAGAGGFRKRVAYVEAGWLDDDLVERSVDAPLLAHPALAGAAARMHRALEAGGDGLRAESELLAIRGVVLRDLGGRRMRERRDDPLAARLRALLDARLTGAPTLADAARELEASASRLVRAFTAAYGIPPHRYLTGRRVDAARHLLLRGTPPAEVAAAVGFYDQAHLTRHFARTLGVTPARFQQAA